MKPSLKSNLCPAVLSIAIVAWYAVSSSAPSLYLGIAVTAILSGALLAYRGNKDMLAATGWGMYFLSAAIGCLLSWHEVMLPGWKGVFQNISAAQLLSTLFFIAVLVVVVCFISGGNVLVLVLATLAGYIICAVVGQTWPKSLLTTSVTPYGLGWALTALIVFVPLGAALYARAAQSPDTSRVRNTAFQGYAVAMIIAVPKTMFGQWNPLSMTWSAYIDKLLTWPMLIVLFIVMLVWCVVTVHDLPMPGEDGSAGAGLSADMDCLVPVVFVGVLWTVKTTLAYPFQFALLVPAAYAIILLVVVPSFGKIASAPRQQTIAKDDRSVGVLFRMVWCSIPVTVIMLLVPLALIAVAAAVYRGYGLAVLAVVLGVAVCACVRPRVRTWGGDGLYWQLVFAAIAVTAWTIALQHADLKNKTVVIVAVFVVASAAMWMMNVHEEIGRNRFLVLKPVMAVVFALVMLLGAFRGAVPATVTFANEQSHNGSMLMSQDGYQIKVGAKNAAKVKSMSYAWSDTFVVDKSKATKVDKKNFDGVDVTIAGGHLRVWVTSTDGVTTTLDRWFDANGFAKPDAKKDGQKDQKQGDQKDQKTDQKKK